MRNVLIGALLLSASLSLSANASAAERLCDASNTNCRDASTGGLIGFINNEKQGIDVGVWFFKDSRFVTALINAKNRGVPIRIIMDPRANAQYSENGPLLDKLAAAGIPMRKRIAGDICHWKLMIFSGQGVVEWSGANFSPDAFVPEVPYQNYEDEVIYFSEQLVPSFMTMFDNIWTNTKEYANYANVPPTLVRNYPTTTIDPRLNFPPKDSYQDRLVSLVDKEPSKGWIDVDMYRITMARPVDALIRAAARGVRIRLYLEPMEYANTARPGNKVQMDRLVAAAQQYPGTIEIRMRKHLGLNHQKTAWFHMQHVVAFGTSNWSDASDDNQLEANFFSDRDPDVPDNLNDFVFDELYKIFERKWTNSSPTGAIETEAWRTPTLPPPSLPANTCMDRTATNFGGPLPCTNTTCTWSISPTTKSMPAAGGSFNVTVTETGTCSWSASSGVSWITFGGGSSGFGSGTTSVVVGANSGTTTRTGVVTIAGKTVNVSQAGSTTTLCTDPTATNYNQPGPCVYPDKDTVVVYPAKGTVHGTFQLLNDGSAAGGTAVWNPNANQAKVSPALSAPANYVERTFTANSATAYHVWIRMQSEGNSFSNDSVHLQFSDSVTSSGAATQRIGTTSSAEFVLQNGAAGPAEHSWGWTDNGWDAPGAPIYFSATGSHTLRIQQREDGAIVDQVVLSPVAYFTNPPGPRSNDTTILPETGTSAPTCTLTLSSSGNSYGAGGSSDTITVTASDPSCTWTASDNASWVTITAGSSGTGTGNVNFTLAANTGAARSATITIGSKTFAISQAAASAPSCTFTLSPTNANYTAAGGSGSFAVTASDPSCTWSATSTATSWLTVDSGSVSGTGNGTVSYTIAANTTAARSGAINVGGQAFAATQEAGTTTSGGSCGTVTLDSSSKTVGGGGEANWVVTVTAPDSTCTWTATSDASWLIVKSTTPTVMPVAGSGTVKVRSITNTTGASRTGHITINGVIYTVKQLAS